MMKIGDKVQVKTTSKRGKVIWMFEQPEGDIVVEVEGDEHPRSALSIGEIEKVGV